MFRHSHSRTYRLSFSYLLPLILFVSIGILASSASMGEDAVANQTAKTASVTASDTPQNQDANQDQTNSSAEEEPKSETTESVQEDVEKNVEEKTSGERQKMVKEAVSAVQLTRDALASLDEGKSQEALDTLEKITGKLELLVARNPSLALVPVGVTTSVYDVIANTDTIEAAVKESRKALGDGEVQRARRILSGLASEVVVSTTNLPLATYPAAIKRVAPLIDEGKTEEAKQELQAALNLLIVSDVVYPLPNMRANIMLGEAQELSEKSDREKEENERLEELLKEVRSQVELGRELGYFTEESAESIYDELEVIEEKTSEGKSGKGFFGKIKGLFDW